MNPVWNIGQGLFQALVWGAIVLLAISVVVILAILVREIRNRQVW